MIYFYLAGSVILGATGHLLAKAGVTRAGSGLIAFFDPVVIAGIACFGLSMALWLPFLSSRPVSVAVPATSLTYVLVALAAWLIKGELLTTVQWGGILMVGVGVWLLNFK
ncbi:EamA family transporter [Desulfotruncus alcoholivorax]|uniref:EamA family transporter n=1 Tax=Desulfotruncus alcoholivorax TaxID=265477 RepID=UPI0003F5933D|nr:EamA family transporter [Desulfotruncus alcoholivorax]